MLTSITRDLVTDLAPLRFSEPVAYVYNPLDYATATHDQYLERFGSGPKEVLFVGMNPGPWGMAQTGVPFGSVSLVRDWLGITGAVGKPPREHPKRLVEGFACPREEVSGNRLWGWARDRFETPERFFERFFVGNYIPLQFLSETGSNLTPDKLRSDERLALVPPCDRALRRLARSLEAEWAIGIGVYAEQQARRALDGLDVRFGRILHPSPASPAANRGWAEAASAQLQALGIALPA